MFLKLPISASLAVALLLASCGGAGTAPTSSPTVAQATATATAAPSSTVTASASAAATPSSPVFAASECTTAKATTRQVVERYLALSTSDNAQAVIDCFAKVWRDKHDTNPTFAESAAFGSQAGPAANVDITYLDPVNGCDRFGVKATMATYANSPFSVPRFFTVGPEAGAPRIFETGTALVNTQSATTTCK